MKSGAGGIASFSKNKDTIMALIFLQINPPWKRLII